MLVIVGLALLSIGGFVCTGAGIFANHAYKSMENAVVNYDEYQEEYNTCQQLNENLGVIESTPDNDPQFSQFSKSQRENAIKLQINRWVETYNGKSKEIDKSLWKSGALPYQLSTDNFSNYNK